MRMLGTGRPFVVEFINPRRVNLTQEQMKAAQVDFGSSELPVVNLDKCSWSSHFIICIYEFNISGCRYSKFLNINFILQIYLQVLNAHVCVCDANFRLPIYYLATMQK